MKKQIKDANNGAKEAQEREKRAVKRDGLKSLERKPFSLLR